MVWNESHCNYQIILVVPPLFVSISFDPLIKHIRAILTKLNNFSGQSEMLNNTCEPVCTSKNKVPYSISQTYIQLRTIRTSNGP